VSTFVVERYLPSIETDQLVVLLDEVRRAARSMTEAGVPIRLLESLHLPSDETCFSLFDAPSADALAEAHRRAGISFDRIVAAVQVADDADPGRRPA
jgi:Protein of unknown function (DUF4242)